MVLESACPAPVFPWHFPAAALTGCGKKQTDTAAPIDQPTQTQTAPEPVDDYKPTKGDKPYYVRVNLQAGTVTVYSRDESGYYSAPYRR